MPLSLVQTSGPGGRIRRRADLDPAELERALGGLAAVPTGLKLLKRDRKTSVYTGLALAGRPVCVKIYRDTRRGRRGFRNLCDLFRRGVPVPEPFFLWERPRAAGKGAAVGMEDLSPRSELDRWLAARVGPGGPPDGRSSTLWPLFRDLGALLRELHGCGIYLDDLKTCNIFVDDRGGPRFRFVDLDGARLGRHLNVRRRVKNLAQLNRSTPVAAGVGSRRAFFREYRRDLPPRDARRIRRAAIALSGARPVVYVASCGVRQEAWPDRAGDWPR